MVSDFLDLPACPGEKICVAIGVFDGVHRGHRKIIASLREMAAVSGSKAVALTFAPHPRAVLGCEPPPLLTPLERRIELLLEAGADAVGVINFTKDFAAMPPEDFISELVHNTKGCPLCGVTVGANWRFGAGGCGDSSMLTAAGEKEGFLFRCVSLLTAEGERVSSSLIRRKAEEGDLEAVRSMLGRDCELYGIVCRDLKIGSRELGFPTANITLSAGVPPPDGVYAGRLDGMPAAVNIGVSPTVEANHLRYRIEAHVIERDVELAGKNVRLELVSKIRSEIKFSGLAALKTQISADVEAVKKIL